MRGHQLHRLRMLAMGQRHAGVGRTRHRGGNAGHHLEGDAVRLQELQFLAATAEYERVAALQPHHAAASERVLEHQRMDLFLSGAVTAGGLADLDTLGIAPCQCQHRPAYQAVVQDHVSLVERA